MEKVKLIKKNGVSRNIIKTITLFIDMTYQNIIGRMLKKKKIRRDIHLNSKILFFSDF